MVNDANAFWVLALIMIVPTFVSLVATCCALDVSGWDSRPTKIFISATVASFFSIIALTVLGFKYPHLMDPVERKEIVYCPDQKSVDIAVKHALQNMSVSEKYELLSHGN